MRVLCCLAVVLSSCGLAAQLQTATPAPLARGDLTQVKLPRPYGTCDPQRNHCVRPTTWFFFKRAYPGTSPPVTPVFERNGKWISYENGEETPDGFVVHTELATPANTKVREALIVWRPNDDEPLWPVSEEAAQTTARWCVMVVETIDPEAATFTIQARPDRPFPLAAARRIVETKEVGR